MEDIVNAAMPFLIGLVLIGVGGFFVWREKRLKTLCTSQVSGVVADEGHSVKYRKGRRKEGYQPTFSYSVEGVEYTKKTAMSYSTCKVFTGQKVTVFYDPSKPQRYYVLELGSIIGNPVVWVPVALGVISMLVGFATRFFL